LAQNPIFVIGAPRSGTTIVAKSLGQHDELWFTHESHLLFNLYGAGHADAVYASSKSRPFGLFRTENVTREEFLASLGVGINSLMSSKSKGKRWIEKTPLNTLMVDVLVDMFPDAYFLHVLRDGRQVVNSMINFLPSRGETVRAFVVEREAILHWADFRKACRTWSRYVDTAVNFCMAHPERCLTIFHEQLVANTADEFHRVSSFLGIHDDEAVKKFFGANRVNSSFPIDAHAPVSAHAKGLSAGTPIDPWQEWSPEQRRIFIEEAGPTLMEAQLVTKAGLLSMSRDAGVGDGGRQPWRRLADCIRDAVDSSVSPRAIVLVVSKGEEDVLQLGERQAWHFPQAEDGGYAGYYPADSAEAITHLETLRAKGAQYLLFPATAFWWLDHYTEFAQHLSQHYTVVFHQDDVCRVYLVSHS
jgi:Sulfotransferase family